MGEGRRFLAWSLWGATTATTFVYAFLLVYFHFLSWNKAVAFSSPNLLILAVSVVAEAVVLAGTVLLKRAVVSSYLRSFEDKETEALKLALASSATLMAGFDTPSEVRELLDEAKLKGWLVLWVGADLVAVLGFVLALVQKNFFYFIPALLIALAVLLKFKPTFDTVRQDVV